MSDPMRRNQGRDMSREAVFEEPGFLEFATLDDAPEPPEYMGPVRTVPCPLDEATVTLLGRVGGAWRTIGQCSARDAYRVERVGQRAQRDAQRLDELERDHRAVEALLAPGWQITRPTVAGFVRAKRKGERAARFVVMEGERDEPLDAWTTVYEIERPGDDR